jgi:hypothetical protein
LSYRSGYYSRSLITRVGTLELRVPQDRMGRFSTELFERYQRSEKALVGTLAEMYVQGVSTRKLKAVTEAGCGHSFSASSISAINKSLDESLQAFAERRLNESYPYLILDARYEKIREGGVILSQAVLVAVAVDEDGRRPDPGGRARQPREPIELTRVSLGAENPRPHRRRVCCQRRPSRAQAGDLRGLAVSRLAALLRAFSEKRVGLCAAQSR